jgi:hypothetical protein
LNAFDGLIWLNDWNDWNCAIAMNFEPGTLNFERDRRLERLERFERPAFASDRGFGKIDKIVGSDPGETPARLSTIKSQQQT